MEIRPTWKNNPLYAQGVIELVPTKWLWRYWGRDVSPVDFALLWKSIEDEGMYDPLIMRVGIQNKKFRLEAGNHRIQLLHEKGIMHAPLTVEVTEECGPHAQNCMTDATHNFDVTSDMILPDTAIGYVRPSSIFTVMDAGIDF